MKKVILISVIFFLVLLSNMGCQREEFSEEFDGTSYFEETNKPEQHMPKNIQYFLSEDGVLTIQGEGEIREKDFDEVVFHDIKKIIIKEGITGIGDECFSYCTQLSSVELPESLSTIGQGAFEGCDNLEKINIPEKVGQIGKRAFFDCSSLKKIVLPDGLTKVENKTFAACHSLEEIILPDGLKEIEKKPLPDAFH
ncbi:MAG: leucine-rich repeat domain-containing protein [Roseburia sp.]|nr:leucine-rich repeat domain-containing protein [Roseburia sp.]